VLNCQARIQVFLEILFTLICPDRMARFEDILATGRSIFAHPSSSWRTQSGSGLSQFLATHGALGLLRDAAHQAGPGPRGRRVRRLAPRRRPRSWAAVIGAVLGRLSCSGVSAGKHLGHRSLLQRANLCQLLQARLPCRRKGFFVSDPEQGLSTLFQAGISRHYFLAAKSMRNTAQPPELNISAR